MFADKNGGLQFEIWHKPLSFIGLYLKLSKVVVGRYFDPSSSRKPIERFTRPSRVSYKKREWCSREGKEETGRQRAGVMALWDICLWFNYLSPVSTTRVHGPSTRPELTGRVLGCIF